MALQRVRHNWGTFPFSYYYSSVMITLVVMMYCNIYINVCAWAKLLQSSPFLCDPMDCRLSGPLFMGFSRQDYQSRLSCPPPQNHPDAGTEPTFLMSPALAGSFFTTSTTLEAHLYLLLITTITNTVDPQTAWELGLPTLWHSQKSAYNL